MPSRGRRRGPWVALHRIRPLGNGWSFSFGWYPVTNRAYRRHVERTFKQLIPERF